MQEQIEKRIAELKAQQADLPRIHQEALNRDLAVVGFAIAELEALIADKPAEGTTDAQDMG